MVHSNMHRHPATCISRLSIQTGSEPSPVVTLFFCAVHYEPYNLKYVKYYSIPRSNDNHRTQPLTVLAHIMVTITSDKSNFNRFYLFLIFGTNLVLFSYY